MPGSLKQKAEIQYENWRDFATKELRVEILGNERAVWSLCPTLAKCRTPTGFGSDSKVEFGSGPVREGE
ncbi:unnamed protein product [Prunus armeniaca]